MSKSIQNNTENVSGGYTRYPGTVETYSVNGETVTIKKDNYVLSPEESNCFLKLGIYIDNLGRPYSADKKWSSVPACIRELKRKGFLK